MVKSAKRIEWEARLKDWKDSGLSKAKWYRDNGFKEHQMYYWIQKINGSELQSNQKVTNADFLKVSVTDEPDELKGSVLIHFDRMSVEVQPDADIGLLSKVLNVLQS